MTSYLRVATGVAAIALAFSQAPALAEPGQAASRMGSGMGSAEKLRRLDIMLMVTSLRCRNGADDFQADFQDFEAHHIVELNGAMRRLKQEIAQTQGVVAAERAADRISVSMANQYGGGHPWLGCHDLKSVAHDLAQAPGESPLLAAADELLSGDGPASRGAAVAMDERPGG